MGNVYIESFGLKFALDGGNEGKRKLGSRHLTLLLQEILMHNGPKVFLKLLKKSYFIPQYFSKGSEFFIDLKKKKS